MLPSLVLLAQFFAHAAGIVQAGSRLLWGRGMSLLELQGTCLACLLATLWVLAGRARQRELEREAARIKITNVDTTGLQGESNEQA